ncbi:PREDICTED: tetratricopeptide repeat protein 39C-like isoform X2 [Nicrophorus vespilloides]|uniref:Tetratricopeptide repeat protein 39C-like isoform X2 n=1 Tax=Nicrophorus vespilloides TaxID=110193 RepID=A0ABM1NDX3_NICVS|nr:PREDICTED: tetratricopeptide repeat protein 39C-like isoform X2 [Nicrophorus vespilloides]
MPPSCSSQDALMSYEEDRLNLAVETLKETEKRCCGSGWLRYIRGKPPDLNYAEYLENQIIKADAELYLATLTFLQQDISGYFKGGWIMRKSWKHYQQTYNEILAIYKQNIGDLDFDGDASDQPEVGENSGECTTSSDTEQELDLDEQKVEAVTDVPDPAVAVTQNGYIPKSLTVNSFTHSSTSTAPSSASSAIPLKKSRSFSGTLNRYTQGLFNVIDEGPKVVDIDRATIIRLMRAVSFGYGLLQLGMSLLPPSVLKLTSFLGFQGNQKSGLEKLVYARNGEDMRSPMATLALLWYHTIVRPFFALDGNNVQAGVRIATTLIAEAMQEYSDSAIFLFFKGRIDRLKSDISSAIQSFNASIANSNHREIRILSQHEVGWCYLIQLEHEHSQNTFLYLKQQSRWSRGFYSYICLISAGANESLQTICSFEDLKGMFTVSPKGSQLDEYLGRRYKCCPIEEELFYAKSSLFWKLLVYELLYLWNSLPSCNVDSLKTVINDCELANGNEEYVPFLGLSELISGSALCILKEYERGITAFRKCLEMRSNCSVQGCDSHITAFALYELGRLLIRDPETKDEGRLTLQQISNYKDYDFEQRLSIRIHSILKQYA